MNQQFYQVGGSLPTSSQSYIKREADDILYKFLKENKYCYVLNARQVGKSSLRVHISKKLEEEGYSCVNIDLTSIGGSESIETDAWYLSFVFEIINQLELDMEKFTTWWEKHEKLTDKFTVVKLFGEIFDEVVLQDPNKKIIIFIDEIDSILGMNQDFSADDFFAVIRTFYNLRSEDERYNQVTFALFGVATPEDLMRDSSRTPFNIAHSVKLNQFKLNESLVLAEGLADNSVESQKILEKIFEWTDGTPYLTQKILAHISQNPIESIDEVDNIVNKLFIEENFKETNISNILTRITQNHQYNVKMLYIIDDLIAKKTVQSDDSHKQQIYLKLSGLVKEEKGELLFSNKIYEKIFNKSWLDETIEKIDRPLTKDLQRWIELKKAKSALLKGEVLDTVREWANGREDVSSVEREYLALSEYEERKSLLSEEKKKGQRRLIKFLIPALVLVSILGYYLLIFNEELSGTNKELKKTNEELEKEKKKNIDITLKGKNKNNELSVRLSESKKDTNITVKGIKKNDNNITEKDYNITKNYVNTIEIDENEVIKSEEVKHHGTTFSIDKKIQKKYKKLIKLALKSKSMDDDERQYWFSVMPVMTDIQINELYVILETEKRKLDAIDRKYAKLEKNAIERNAKLQKSNIRNILDGNISEENIIGLASAIDSNEDLNTYKKIKNKLNSLVKNKMLSKKYNLYLNATLSKRIEEYDNAINQYQELLKLYDVENLSKYSEKEMNFIIDIYERVSKIYESKNQLENSKKWKKKTMDLIKQLIKKFPTKENITKKFKFYNKIITVLEKRKKYKEAINYINRQVSFLKKNKKILFNNDETKYKNELLKLYISLGWNYNENGNFKQSITLYEKAIELNPKKDYLYRNMALTYGDNKQYEKAIEMHNKSIELNDDYALNYAYLANTYGKSGNLKKATDNYIKALKYDSSYIYGYLNIFELEVAQNLPFDSKLEKKFLSIYKDEKEYLMDYDMMKIFKDIVNKKEVDLNAWSRKYSDIGTDWDFFLTDDWIRTIKDKKIKRKLLEATKIFKNHNKKEQ